VISEVKPVIDRRHLFCARSAEENGAWWPFSVQYPESDEGGGNDDNDDDYKDDDGYSEWYGRSSTARG
jgi:hypothetical protein